MNYKKIGEFICQLRKEKDMTQKDLADKLHITEQAVSKWERGLGAPDIALFKPLSKILDISINELMNGEIITNDNMKEKAEDAISNVLNHSQNIIAKKNKQVILVIMGILLVIYGYNTYGLYSDYSTLFGFTFFPYKRFIIVLGVIADIVSIITGLIISKNKRKFIVFMSCILSIIAVLNIFCAYNDYILLWGIDISNIIRFIMILLGVFTTIIGLMLGSNKIKITLTVIVATILLFLGTYSIDMLTYNATKIRIFSRHYDYSDILKKAGDIRNEKNKGVVDKVIKGIKDLQKQQGYVDLLNNREISIKEGDTFIFKYSISSDFMYIEVAYDEYEKNNNANYRPYYDIIANDYNDNSSEISKDIYYAIYSSGASAGSYKYCNVTFKNINNSLFPTDDEWGYGSCDFPLQLYYELEHENGVRVFGRILDDVK